MDKERNLHSRWRITKNIALRKERNLPALLTFTHIPFSLILSSVTTTSYLWFQIPPLSIFLLSIYPPISLCLLIAAGSFTRFCAAQRKTIVLSIKARISVCFVCLYHLLLLLPLLSGPVGLCHSAYWLTNLLHEIQRWLTDLGELLTHVWKI